MKRLRRCETCQHGIRTYDGKADTHYAVCSLIPPTPLATVRMAESGPVPFTDWVRPSMSLTGWCGQHKLSLWKLFGGKGA